MCIYLIYPFLPHPPLLHPSSTPTPSSGTSPGSSPRVFADGEGPAGAGGSPTAQRCQGVEGNNRAFWERHILSVLGKNVPLHSMANLLISHSFQELAQARAAGSPGKALPASSSSFLQQQAATITNLQGEKAQLRSTLSRLQGQISDLEEEKAQNKVRKGVVLILRSSHHPVFDHTLGRPGNKASDGIHDFVFSRCILLLGFHFLSCTTE